MRYLCLCAGRRKVWRSMRRKDQRTRARRRHATAFADRGETETREKGKRKGAGERGQTGQWPRRFVSNTYAFSPFASRWPAIIIGEILRRAGMENLEKKSAERKRKSGRATRVFLSVSSGRYPRVRSFRRRDFRLGLELLLLLLLLQGEKRGCHIVVLWSRYMNLEESNCRRTVR